MRSRAGRGHAVASGTWATDGSEGDPEGTSIRLTWQAPPPDGSPAITGYRIEMYSNAHPQWVEVEDDTGSPGHHLPA